MRRHEARELAGRTDLPLSIQREVRRVLAPRKGGAAKKARRMVKLESRRERMAAIRKDVMERATGVCELCSLVEYTPFVARAQEVHHVLSGVGNRRIHEDVSTCVAVCECHHHQLHRNDPDALSLLLRWAEKHGTTRAMAAIEHRQAKAAESRAASGGPK